MKNSLKSCFFIFFLFAIPSSYLFASHITAQDRYQISVADRNLVITQSPQYTPTQPVQESGDSGDESQSPPVTPLDLLWQYLDSGTLTITPVLHNQGAFTLSLATALSNDITAIAVQTFTAQGEQTDQAPAIENLFIQHFVQLLGNNIEGSADNFFGISQPLSLANLFSEEFFEGLAAIISGNQVTAQTVTVAGNFNSNGSSVPVSTTSSMQLSESDNNLQVSSHDSENTDFLAAQNPTAILTPLTSDQLQSWTNDGTLPSDPNKNPDYLTLWQAIKTCSWAKYWNQPWTWGPEGQAEGTPDKAKQETISIMVKNCGLSFGEAFSANGPSQILAF